MGNQRRLDNVDELHKLNMETYFKEMGLSDGQTQSREELADMLIEFFLLYMSDIAELDLRGSEDDRVEILDSFKEKAENELNTKLEEYGFSFKRYPEIEEYSKRLIDEITDTTIDNIDTPFFTSKDRVDLISADHTNSIYNYVDYADAVRQGATQKQWMTIIDDRTRPWHHDADKQTVGIKEMFYVGDEPMRFPHDPNASLKNIARCRCVCVYK